MKIKKAAAFAAALSFLAAAAGKKDYCNDNEPDDVVTVKKIAKAVVHSKTSVIWGLFAPLLA